MRQKLPIFPPTGIYFMTLIRFVLHTLFSSFQPNIFWKKNYWCHKCRALIANLHILVFNAERHPFQDSKQRNRRPWKPYRPRSAAHTRYPFRSNKGVPLLSRDTETSQARLLPQLSCTSYNSCTTLYVFLNDRGLFGTNLLLCCVYQQQHSPAGSWLCFSGIRLVHLMIPRPL